MNRFAKPGEKADQMAKVLSMLEEEDRNFIVLRFISELYIREIGGVLEICEESAREKLWGALNHFREACAEGARFQDD